MSKTTKTRQLHGYLEGSHTDTCSLTRKLRARMYTYVDVETDERISTNIIGNSRQMQVHCQPGAKQCGGLCWSWGFRSVEGM